jgi:hypothetical protein
MVDAVGAIVVGADVVGSLVGNRVGSLVGTLVGIRDGSILGVPDEATEGTEVGLREGEEVADCIGERVGLLVPELFPDLQVMLSTDTPTFDPHIEVPLHVIELIPEQHLPDDTHP